MQESEQWKYILFSSDLDSMYYFLFYTKNQIS